jgi:hypothetical protein
MSGRSAFVCCLLGGIAGIQVSAEEPQGQEAMLRFLREKSQVNKDLLRNGEVHATFRRTHYDITGRKPGAEEVMQIHALFKGDKVRVDWEGLRGRVVRQWRTVLTNEEYLEWMVRSNAAAIVAPETGRGKVGVQLGVLPWRNLASSNWCVTEDETLLSREITRSDLAGHEVYVVKVVSKDSPKDTRYYYMDPARGAAVVRSESRYEFGRGPVLVSEADVELQDAQNGAWCLKRYADTVYREDRTILVKEVIEIGDFDFKSEVPDRVFTWEGMGLPDGTMIKDMRFDGVYYKYGQSAVDDKLILDAVNHPLVKETIAQAPPVAEPESKESTRDESAGRVLAQEGSRPGTVQRKIAWIVLAAGAFVAASLAVWRAGLRRRGETR